MFTLETASWHVLRLNPEPWRIGPLSVIRRGGKYVPTISRDAQLSAFKESVSEALGVQRLQDGKVLVVFYFWRRRDSYVSHQAKTVRKHEADATNMQKATEDALQGVFFKNDKDVWDIRSRIVEQDEVTEPLIVVKVAALPPFDRTEIPPEIWAQIDHQPDLFNPEGADNVWPPVAQT